MFKNAQNIKVARSSILRALKYAKIRDESILRAPEINCSQKLQNCVATKEKRHS